MEGSDRPAKKAEVDGQGCDTLVVPYWCFICLTQVALMTLFKIKYRNFGFGLSFSILTFLGAKFIDEKFTGEFCGAT